MKVMRSTKTGSVCGDCGSEIKIDDPIAYFGPGRVFGLTCHSNEKTQKHLKTLLEEERVGGKIGIQVPNAPQSDRPRENSTPEAAQEWVVRITLRSDLTGGEFNAIRWMFKGRFGGQLLSDLSIVEVRAPRGVSTQMTKQWADLLAKEPCPFGEVEAAPLYVEGGTR